MKVKPPIHFTIEQEEVANFIRLIRGISPMWLKYACSHGACFRFHSILKNRFHNAIPYIVRYNRDSHVVSRINNRYWDIYGLHEPKFDGKVEKMNAKEIELMSSCYFEEAQVIDNSHYILENQRTDPQRRIKEE
jgi:hypothetical protein